MHLTLFDVLSMRPYPPPLRARVDSAHEARYRHSRKTQFPHSSATLPPKTRVDRGAGCQRRAAGKLGEMAPLFADREGGALSIFRNRSVAVSALAPSVSRAASHLPRSRGRKISAVFPPPFMGEVSTPDLIRGRRRGRAIDACASLVPTHPLPQRYR